MGSRLSRRANEQEQEEHHDHGVSDHRRSSKLMKTSHTSKKKRGSYSAVATGRLPADILTDEEIEHIKLTWPGLKSHLNRVLSQAFVDLFTQSPDIKDKFVNFRDFSISDLQRRRPHDDGSSESALDRHVPRVARVIVKVVHHVDNLDHVMDYLECIGKIHHRNGIMAHEVGMLGSFFTSNASRYFPEKMRSRVDVHESWNRLFVVITDLMSRGYPHVEFELTLEEKALIKRTFCLLQRTMADVGASAFLELFRTYSTSKMFFPTFRDSPMEDLAINEALQNHGQRVMKVIESVVHDLEEPSRVSTFLAHLGHVHQTMGIEKRFLDVIGPIFVQAIRPVLQEEEEWSLDVRHAWLHLFRIVAFKMKRGYRNLEQPANVANSNVVVTTFEDDDEEEEQEQEYNQYLNFPEDFRADVSSSTAITPSSNEMANNEALSNTSP